MWWFMLPKWLKAALGGALALSLALGLAWGYVERERRQAAQAERLRIEKEAFRDRLTVIEQERNRANEIDGIGDDDLHDRLRRWLRPE